MGGSSRRVGVALLVAVGFSVTASGEAWAQKTIGHTPPAEAQSQVGDHDGDSVVADPGNATSYRGQNSLFVNIEVTGDARGSVWGDGIYTDDSAIATAAVHVGVLKAGQKGVVTIEIVPGIASYAGSTANGVTSGTYGSWEGSYRFIDMNMIASIPVETAAPALDKLRDQQGLIERYTVTGTTKGQIWGDNIYTDDSPLGTAAVHEGIVANGETAVVAIEILPGQDSYAASDRNAVKSSESGKFDGSYRFLFSYVP